MPTRPKADAAGSLDASPASRSNLPPPFGSPASPDSRSAATTRQREVAPAAARRGRQRPGLRRLDEYGLRYGIAMPCCRASRA